MGENESTYRIGSVGASVRQSKYRSESRDAGSGQQQQRYQAGTIYLGCHAVVDTHAHPHTSSLALGPARAPPLLSSLTTVRSVLLLLSLLCSPLTKLTDGQAHVPRGPYRRQRCSNAILRVPPAGPRCESKGPDAPAPGVGRARRARGWGACRARSQDVGGCGLWMWWMRCSSSATSGPWGDWRLAAGAGPAVHPRVLSPLLDQGARRRPHCAFVLRQPRFATSGASVGTMRAVPGACSLPSWSLQP